jgi:hypothetical protein
VQSGLSARLVDEKEVVDKNNHKFEESWNRIDEMRITAMQECGQVLCCKSVISECEGVRENCGSQGLDGQILAGGSLYCCTAVRLKTKVFSFSLFVLIQATC